MKINEIKTDSIIITPNNIKPYLIKEIRKNNPFCNVKFISKQELLNAYFFNYDEKAIYFLHEKYNLSYANAKEILDNLKCLDIEIAKNEIKLKDFIVYYNDLKNNKLLEFDNLFFNLFKDKNVYVFGYHKDDLDLKILNKLNIKYEFINIEKNNYKPQVYSFLSMDEEIDYLFISIGKLISENIDLSHIFIYEIPSEYESSVLKYKELYNLPINLDYSYKLSTSEIYNRFINYYLKTKDLKASFEKIENINSKDVEKISNIIVKINDINPKKEEIIDLLNYFAKNTTIKYKTYKNGINIIDSSYIISDDDYVFMIGFNSNNYPTVNKDNSIISDEIKEKLGQNTSIIKNKINKENLINFISASKNLIISFKEKHNSKECFKSNLINELNLEIKSGELGNKRYSKKALEIEIVKYKDILSNYNIKNEYVDAISDKELGYKLFDNKFKQPNLKINGDLLLSYTSVSDYYGCPFKYFIERVLNIGEFENKFRTKLGNVCHKILEDTVKENIPFDKINLDDFNELFDKNFITSKEKYYGKRLVNQMYDVIKKNQEFELEYKFIPKAEEEFKIDIDEKTKLVGKIDRYLIDDNNHVIIVDYKTGEVHFDERLLKYGLSLQLPIYDYLLTDKYNYVVLGIYIQKIIDKEEEEIDKKYLLDGVTNIDPKFIKILLKDIKEKEASKYIKNLSFNNKGEINSKLKPYNEKYKDIAKNKIIEANKKIRNFEFPIKPVAFNSAPPKSCDFCDHKDICFKNKWDEARYKLEEVKKNANKK